MKVFVSPSEAAVESSEDFVFTRQDELVCLWDCPCEDSSCEAVFSGFETHKASSLATIVERADVNEAVMEDMIRRDLVNRGWLETPLDGEAEQWITELTWEACLLPRDFEVGAIVVRTDEGVALRTPAQGQLTL